MRIIFILLLTINCFAESLNKSHTDNYYNQLALNHNITPEVKIEKVMKWFTKEIQRIDFVCKYNYKTNIISAKYYLRDNKKLTGTLEIQFNGKDNSYRNIIFKMCVNGSPKYYTGKRAERILLTFISYNDKFNYYWK